MNEYLIYINGERRGNEHALTHFYAAYSRVEHLANCFMRSTGDDERTVDTYVIGVKDCRTEECQEFTLAFGGTWSGPDDRSLTPEKITIHFERDKGFR